MNDSTLRQDIIDELDFDPSIDAAHIGVAVEDGIVTLTGHLCTYAEKALVEDVVRRIRASEVSPKKLRFAHPEPTRQPTTKSPGGHWT
jgi:hypothetical protein